MKNEHFSKIKMKCTVLSEDQVAIPYKLEQTDSNTFSIRIKSTDPKSSRSNQITSETPRLKRKRSNDDVANSDIVEQNIERPIANDVKKWKRGGRKSKALVRVIAKPKPCEHVNEGDIVLCKMRGYCSWPAIVTEINQNSVSVEFFGDHTTQKTTLKNLYTFHESHSEIISNLKRLKNPLYKKAILEVERILRIPENKSIVNQIV